MGGGRGGEERRERGGHSYSMNNSFTSSSPCRSFLQGYCKFGSSCRFSHGFQREGDDTHENGGANGSSHFKSQLSASAKEFSFNPSFSSSPSFSSPFSSSPAGVPMRGFNSFRSFDAEGNANHAAVNNHFSAPSNSNSFSSSYSSGNRPLYGKYNPLIPDARKEAELFPPPAEGEEQEEEKDLSLYDSVPVEVSGLDVPPPLASFSTSTPPLPPPLVANIARAHYSSPTPIQRYCLPIALAGRDIMACAQTGSGKDSRHTEAKRIFTALLSSLLLFSTRRLTVSFALFLLLSSLSL